MHRKPTATRAASGRACVVAALLLGCGGAELQAPREPEQCTRDARAIGPADPHYDDAIAAIDRWIAEHPSEWRLAIDDPDAAHALARPDWSEPCAERPQSGLVVLRYQSAGTEIDFHFRCPIADPSGAAGLRAAFSHVALQRLPHGVSVPHWRIGALTPSSSFSDGVAFDRVEGGRLAVTITTRLFALRGDSELPACQPLADASSPPCCFVHREHRPTLHLSLIVPYSPAAFDAVGH